MSSQKSGVMTFESAVSLSRMRRYRTVATDRISSRWSGSTHVDAAASLDDSSAAPAKIGGTAIKGVCFTFPCVTLLPLLPELDGEVRLLPVQEGILHPKPARPSSLQPRPSTTSESSSKSWKLWISEPRFEPRALPARSITSKQANLHAGPHRLGPLKTPVAAQPLKCMNLKLSSLLIQRTLNSYSPT